MRSVGSATGLGGRSVGSSGRPVAVAIARPAVAPRSITRTNRPPSPDDDEEQQDAELAVLSGQTAPAPVIAAPAPAAGAAAAAYDAEYDEDDISLALPPAMIALARSGPSTTAAIAPASKSTPGLSKPVRPRIPTRSGTAMSVTAGSSVAPRAVPQHRLLPSAHNAIVATVSHALDGGSDDDDDEDAFTLDAPGALSHVGGATGVEEEATGARRATLRDFIWETAADRSDAAARFKSRAQREAAARERDRLAQGVVAPSSTSTAAGSGSKSATSAALVKLVDGAIVIDRDSLPVAPSNDVVYTEEDGATPTARRSGAFKSGRPGAVSERWTAGETVKFFAALRRCGTDFSMMAALFPSRDRRNLKSKFTREQALHPALVDAALRTTLPFRVEEMKSAAKAVAAQALRARRETAGEEEEPEPAEVQLEPEPVQAQPEPVQAEEEDELQEGSFGGQARLEPAAAAPIIKSSSVPIVQRSSRGTAGAKRPRAAEVVAAPVASQDVDADVDEVVTSTAPLVPVVKSKRAAVREPDASATDADAFNASHAAGSRDGALIDQPSASDEVVLAAHNMLHLARQGSHDHRIAADDDEDNEEEDGDEQRRQSVKRPRRAAVAKPIVKPSRSKR